MCDKCNDVILRKNFFSDKDYLNCLEYISELIDTNAFKMSEQTCPLNAVKSSSGRWVADIIEHRMTCKICGQSFLAWADTYHGRGGFTKEVD